MFAAVDRDDISKDVESMAGKVLKMKMWPDEMGRPVRDFRHAFGVQDNSYIKHSGSVVFKILRARCSAVSEKAGLVDFILKLRYSLTVYIAGLYEKG